jgi:hypothetical protein
LTHHRGPAKYSAHSCESGNPALMCISADGKRIVLH